MGASAAKPAPPEPVLKTPKEPLVPNGGVVDLEHVRWVLANILNGPDGPDHRSLRWWRNPDVASRASTAQSRKLWRLTLGAGSETNLGHFHFTDYLDIERQTDGEPVYALSCAILARHRHPFDYEGPNLDFNTPFRVARLWMPHLTWATSISPSNQQEVEQLVLEALVSWNTAKAIILLASLKNNNVGPYLRDKVFMARSYAGPWQRVFPGDVQECAWAELMAAYDDYYYARFKSSDPILAGEPPHQRRQMLARLGVVILATGQPRNPHLPHLPPELYDLVAYEFFL